MTTIALPRLIELGAGSSRLLNSVLQRIGCQRPLLLTDTTMHRIGHVERVLEPLRLAGVTCPVCAETVPEPTVSSLRPGLEQVLAGQHDAIVALGGGSVIDSAKALAVLARHGGSMRDYKVPACTDAPALPVIAIPTTAGTGSEATRFTIITDDANDEKMLCAGLAFLPVAALIDFELTCSAPPRITADTGLDALTHAIEAYVSRKANPFSDAQALSAMRLIGPNLRRAYQDGQDRAAREALMLGAHLAGIAFSNASVALVHGMSRPIGAHFHVPHGLSNAMLLPAITAYGLEASAQRYADCARMLGVAGPDQDTTSAGQALVHELRQLNTDLAVPGPRGAGIDPSRFDSLLATMASQALASGSPANNPRVPDQGAIIALYRSVLHEEIA